MGLLSFNLKDIPPEGLDVACDVRKEDLQLEEQDPGIRDVLALTAAIRADEAEFWVEGELNGLLVHECVRCLEAFDAPANLSFRACYRDPHHRRATRKGAEKIAGDPDVDETDSYPVVNQHIELHELLREHVILSTPMQPLCSDGCRGLCQVCGHNLNVSECGCEAVKTESPFGVLREARPSSSNPLAS